MSDSLRVRAHAKINLYLNVTGKRADGYHDVETIFHSVQLHDDVIIRKQAWPGISIFCEHPLIPRDERNLAYRAAQLFMAYTGIRHGVGISIVKRIPIAAGLAGGSADAAAVLWGMNRLFDLDVKQIDLMRLGKQLGADVPFCLLGGAALGRGVGELLTPLPAMDDVWIVLGNPGFEVSTAWAFQNLDFPLTNPPQDVIIPIRYMETGDVRGVAGNMYNALEACVFPRYPQIEALKTKFSDYGGSYGALMSGTGATVFSLVQDGNLAHQMACSFGSEWSFCTATATSKTSLCIA